MGEFNYVLAVFCMIILAAVTFWSGVWFGKRNEEERHSDVLKECLDILKECYAFHSIEEKPDKDGKYLVQYEGDIISIQNFDADENAFGMWSSQPADVCGYWPCEKGKGRFIVQESCIVAWARLPEKYKEATHDQT